MEGQADMQIDHEEEVQSSKPFVCDVCSKEYKHDSSLFKHLKTHEEKSFDCLKCSKSFRSDDLARDQLRKTHGDKKMQHLCTDCGALFKSNTALTNHVRFKHNNNGLVCKTCSKHFKDNYALTRHTESHMKTMEECSICKQRFRDVASHKKSCKKDARNTSRKRTYECDTCGKKFLCKRYLQTHMSCKHANPDRYRCSRGKLFSYTTSLKRHKRFCTKQKQHD